MAKIDNQGTAKGHSGKQSITFVDPSYKTQHNPDVTLTPEEVLHGIKTESGTGNTGKVEPGKGESN